MLTYAGELIHIARAFGMLLNLNCALVPIRCAIVRSGSPHMLTYADVL